MIVLTNCLTEKADEGCLKVANSLIKRIKQADPSVTVVSYGKETELSDLHLNLNKLFASRKLRKLLRVENRPVLYIPFSSNTKASILRTAVLSHYSKNKTMVLFALRHPMGRLAKGILRGSGAKVLALSKESYEFYKKFAPTVYLKAGVDAKRFHPVVAEEKAKLREVYGIPDDKPVVLHVGHLKEGRNIRSLLDVEERAHVVLVVSSLTEGEWDQDLRKDLLKRKNLTLIDHFVEKIEQIYQLADVYVFPVEAAGNCIDIPLSALEAAACGIPVVTTAYGELKEIIHQEGFYSLPSTDPEQLNLCIKRAFEEKASPRDSAMDYDWNRAVAQLLAE